MNKLRIHYFFTEEGEDISDFKRDTEIEMRITDGPDYNKLLAVGNVRPMEHFNLERREII